MSEIVVILAAVILVSAFLGLCMGYAIGSSTWGRIDDPSEHGGSPL